VQPSPSPFLSAAGCRIVAIYGPTIYPASCVMFLLRANALRGQVGGGWALEIEISLGPLKWHRAFRRVPFEAQKSRLALVMHLPASKTLHTGPYQSEFHR
jgi:hypothetical protein